MVVASNVVDQVCAGTIDRLDRGVEHIDEQLGLPESDERVPVAILELSDAWRLCGRGRAACAQQRGPGSVAVLSPGAFERAAVHELAHARVGAQRSGNVALFNEGIAVAVSPAFCAHDDELPSADELLEISTGWNLSDSGYWMGGELVTWLLEAHGPERLMSFLATLQRPEALSPSADPEFVRSSYRSHFGSEIDEDLHAHLREPGQISPEGVGCVAPKATWSGNRVRLTST
ncbi:MAG TPA: hypothetical protein VM869_13490, partial [Enhygromyxa sp.]|nr:hypothetical protein [Enhygromyxa sp.]